MFSQLFKDSHKQKKMIKKEMQHQDVRIIIKYLRKVKADRTKEEQLNWPNL